MEQFEHPLAVSRTKLTLIKVFIVSFVYFCDFFPFLPYLGYILMLLGQELDIFLSLQIK